MNISIAKSAGFCFGVSRAVEVVADSIYFCGSREQSARPSEGNADESSFPPAQGGEFTEMDDDDGKLPF